MYVLSNYTYTPDVGDYDRLVIPGVYSIEEFDDIQNATRNTTLYTSGEVVHLGSIQVSDDGVQTTVLIYPANPSSDPTDEIRILMYNQAPTGSGPTSNVAVTNWPASQNINGTVSVTGEVEISNDTGNPLPISGSISVDNFPASFEVSNDAGNPLPISGSISGSVSVDNFPASFEVSNDAGNPLPVSGTITADQGTSPWVVSGTTSSTVSAFPTTSTDAFGRLRISQPYTLFDASNRYSANGSFATQTSLGSTVTFNADQGLVDLTVTGLPGSTVRRETTKVFSYQPGKSLLLYTTFVMDGGTGLRQSVGYYNDYNGYYLERDENGVVSIVERSSVSGVVTDTPALQTNWNVDPFDGTGPSGISLDFTKAQILWIDMEWLGVGTVRTGFVVDGQLLPANYFQHANVVGSTYITTACLPFRYEIENISSVPGGTLKQICSTAISEGGYTLTGEQHSVSTDITTPYQLPAAGTYYPVAVLRLKNTHLDAISIVTGLSLLGAGNNETYSWRVVSGGTVTGGTWNTVSSTTPVEYNLTGTSVTGGTVLASGFTNASNQGSPIIDILKGSLFSNQLERDPFTSVATEFILEVAPANNTQEIYASVNWEDVVR